VTIFEIKQLQQYFATDAAAGRQPVHPVSATRTQHQAVVTLSCSFRLFPYYNKKKEETKVLQLTHYDIEQGTEFGC